MASPPLCCIHLRPLPTYSLPGICKYLKALRVCEHVNSKRITAQAHSIALSKHSRVQANSPQLVPLSELCYKPAAATFKICSLSCSILLTQ